MTWEKFKAMPFKKKLEHIWEYYRWQIFVTLLVAVCLGSWIHTAVSRRDPILQVLMVNAYASSDGGEAFQDFLEEQGREYYEDAVIVGRNIHIDGPDVSQNLGGAQMLMCSVAAGEPDLIFWDTKEMIPLLDGGPLIDLGTLLPEEILDRYRDSLVYGRSPEDGSPYPCGIYLEENPWVMDHSYYVNCTASVSVTCKEPELAGQFLRYLLRAQEEKPSETGPSEQA